MNTHSTSSFTELFNDNPNSRVLDVFLCGREFDYTMTDASKTTGINRQRMVKIIRLFLKLGVLRKTRLLGGRQLYQLNKTDPLAKALTNIFDQSIEKRIREKVKP